MIDVDSKLLAALQTSTCFGIAHDETVPECKQCDVKAQCKAKVEGANIQPPIRREKPPVVAASTGSSDAIAPKTTAKDKAADKPPAKAAKPKAPSKPKAASSDNPNMPNFKPMSLKELKDLAGLRSVEYKEYENENIMRMRIIMALKASY